MKDQGRRDQEADDGEVLFIFSRKWILPVSLRRVEPLFNIC